VSRNKTGIDIAGAGLDPRSLIWISVSEAAPPVCERASRISDSRPHCPALTLSLPVRHLSEPLREPNDFDAGCFLRREAVAGFMYFEAEVSGEPIMPTAHPAAEA
jgi:hypothetical protein